MNEQDLEKLSIDALFDLLMQNTKELMDLVHKSDKTEYEAKKEEVQLLQKVIVVKRADEKPG